MANSTNSQEYIDAWNQNAKKHFDDGDYAWLCEKIHTIPTSFAITRILEIGCGSGWSTLSLLLGGFKTISIDINESAIETTNQLLESLNPDYRESVKFINADIVCDLEDVCSALIDETFELIVLCNPGGNTLPYLKEQEKVLLDSGNFQEDEYYEENLPQLHTYSMIFASCVLAKYFNKPLLIVQRDEHECILMTLQRIADDTGLELINHCVRKIDRLNDSGVKISGEGDLFWGIGLYCPKN